MRSRLTYSHTTLAVIGHTVESGAAIVGEVLFTSPDLLHVIGAARPTIGGSVNTDGKTDYIYFDMTWSATLGKPLQGDGIYLGAFVGGAAHDGRLNEARRRQQRPGAPALFHPGVEAGYQITPAYSIELYFSHLSNAFTSSQNV